MAKIRQRKNSTRKETIIETAARLFRERGFSATSMRDLAEQVGVEAASLYNHISSKAEILQELCFKVANKFMSHIDKVDASELSAIKKIEAVLRFHIQQMLHHYEEVYVSDREWRYLAEPYISTYQNQRRDYRKRFAAIIQQGIDQGQINPIDSSTAVLILLHAIGGIESWQRSTHKISGEELEENMLTILIHGIKK